MKLLLCLSLLLLSSQSFSSEFAGRYKLSQCEGDYVAIVAGGMIGESEEGDSFRIYDEEDNLGLEVDVGGSSRFIPTQMLPYMKKDKQYKKAQFSVEDTVIKYKNKNSWFGMCYFDSANSDLKYPCRKKVNESWSLELLENGDVLNEWSHGEDSGSCVFKRK